MRHAFVLVLGLLCAFGAVAQQLRPEQMMILLIGASATYPTADQQAVLERLKQLRQQPAFQPLKIATMHYDRPKEAQFARKVLGVQADQLPCLCLVQLDSKGQKPVRKLYAIPKVTRHQLDQVEVIGRQWAQQAGLQVSNLIAQDVLRSGQNLMVGSALQSANKQYSFSVQGDGNLVLYRINVSPWVPLWHSKTSGSGGSNLVLGTDGVLRLLAANGSVVWSTQRGGGPGSYHLAMQSDGNLVLYKDDPRGNIAIWATETMGR